MLEFLFASVFALNERVAVPTRSVSVPTKTPTVISKEISEPRTAPTEKNSRAILPAFEPVKNIEVNKSGSKILPTSNSVKSVKTLNTLKSLNTRPQNLDADNDGFADKIDLCKTVPGKNRGCPNVNLYTKNYEKFWKLEVVNENFETKEKTEIKIGDEIFAGFKHRQTKEIFEASARVKINK